MKWIKCADRLPPNPENWNDVKQYLTATVNKDRMSYFLLTWADGWNCNMSPNGAILRDYEIKDIVAWMEIPKYEETQKEDLPIGEQIKQSRKAHKMTQDDLAEMTGLTKQTIWNYETGAYEPSRQSLFKIANILNTQFKYTFTAGGTKVTMNICPDGIRRTHETLRDIG